MRQYPNKKGVSLIIAIFVMMVLAGLGWSLAVMQCGDFEASLRQVESERALYLAEAGVQWALREMDTKFCCHSGRHRLDFGEYRVESACADATKNCSCRTREYFRTCREIIVTSTGYIPSQDNPHAMRQVEVVVSKGAFSNAGTIRNLFDWSEANYISVKGDIVAKNFNRNGPPYNEDVDLAVPPDSYKRTATAPNEPKIPSIDMADFEANASRIWAGPRTSTITSITESDGKSIIEVKDEIFKNPPSQWEHQALRNISRGRWKEGNWAEISSASWNRREVTLDRVVDWEIGERVAVVPRIAEEPQHQNNTYTITVNCNFFTEPLSQWRNQAIRNLSRGSWRYSDWGVIQDVRPHPDYDYAQIITVEVDDSVNLNLSENLWKKDEWIDPVNRFEGWNYNQGWYIKGDVLIDVRNRPALFWRTSLVAEGDIAIKGSRGLFMYPYYVRSPSGRRIFPCLATKFGNILSPDRGLRIFGGLIYTEFGDVLFTNIDYDINYGIAIIGNNVTLGGYTRLYYIPWFIDDAGFSGNLSAVNWRER